MPDSRLLPVQFPDKPAPPAALPDPVIPARGEFILSGSLTPLPHGTAPLHELTGVRADPMPGFHSRKEVQRMLRRWRNTLSLWGRILSSPSSDARDARERLLLPNHSMYIR
ncbi:hypothetical protein QFZ50_003108 [Arthrobacter agilis]|nr:hypothetical protein [Arthrobacter agilis]